MDEEHPITGAALVRGELLVEQARVIVADRARASVLEVLAPEIAEELEKRLLEQEERRASESLDLGRARMFHTKAQRIAVGLRDGGCAAEGCDWPPGMCTVHHRTPWSRGGRTSVADVVMLCPRHHAFAHDARYRVASSPAGKVTFARRT